MESRWSRNRRADTSIYESYLNSKARISKQVYDRVNKVREAQKELQDIQVAYEEYITLACGNEEVAMNFLIKTYGEEKARAAVGRPLETQEAAQEESQEATA